MKIQNSKIETEISKLKLPGCFYQNSQGETTSRNFNFFFEEKKKLISFYFSR